MSTLQFKGVAIKGDGDNSIQERFRDNVWGERVVKPFHSLSISMRQVAEE